MNSVLIWQIVLQMCLILLNAVFACAEIAVIAMNDTRLAKLVQEGDSRALKLARLTSQPARFLATIQVAITLSGFLGSAFAADNFSVYLVTWLEGLGVPLPRATLDTFALVVITLLLSYFTLVFGELVPKRLAMKRAEALALRMAGFISVVSRLTAPPVWFLTLSTNAILRLFGIDPKAEENEVSEEEIRMMVDIGNQKGVIASEEKEFIQNVFDFNDTPVGEFVTHRTQMCFLDMADSEEVWDKTIRASRFSRFPIYEGSPDQIIGILNSKDYFRLGTHTRAEVLAQAVEAPFFVPHTIYADVLFGQMKASRARLAVVLDEHSGVLGMVTLYDLIELLVGDLGGSFTQRIEQTAPDVWEIQGDVAVKAVGKALGIQLPPSESGGFGMFLFERYGFIPPDNTVFSLDIEGFHIEVQEIHNHRLQRATITRLAPET